MAKTLIYAFVTLFAIVVGVSSCAVNSVDSYWEEELPCGTSSQGTFISIDQDGSWSDWVECKGY